MFMAVTDIVFIFCWTSRLKRLSHTFMLISQRKFWIFCQFSWTRNPEKTSQCFNVDPSPQKPRQSSTIMQKIYLCIFVASSSLFKIFQYLYKTFITKGSEILRAVIFHGKPGLQVCFQIVLVLREYWDNEVNCSMLQRRRTPGCVTKH